MSLVESENVSVGDFLTDDSYELAEYWMKEVLREGDILGAGNFGGFVVPDVFGSELF
ncbi:MAG: hypothetical protein LBL26_08310 [Peptococcaceae bacterium]|nr:hypothetical protein [Peptococcaceae bacterium]